MPFTVDEKVTGKNIVVLLDNGNHIDIAIDRQVFFDHAPLEFQPYKDFFPAKTFVAVGWGDENFMLNHGTIDTVTSGDLFEASFRSKSSAIRLSFVSQNVLKRTETIHLSDVDQIKLIEHIARAEDKVLRVDERNEEIYLRSPLEYSLLNTCNDWTASALRSIEQPTPFFVTTSGSIIRYYQRPAPTVE